MAFPTDTPRLNKTLGCIPPSRQPDKTRTVNISPCWPIIAHLNLPTTVSAFIYNGTGNNIYMATFGSRACLLHMEGGDLGVLTRTTHQTRFYVKLYSWITALFHNIATLMIILGGSMLTDNRRVSSR